MTFNHDDDQDQPNQNACMLQLEHEFLLYKLDILCVSEARWIGSGSVKTPSGHTVFLYSGKDEGTEKTTFGGCPEDVRNKRGADIGYAHDHHLMIATLRLRTAVAKKRAEEARLAPTYFTERLKCPIFLKNFNEKVIQYASSLAMPQ